MARGIKARRSRRAQVERAANEGSVLVPCGKCGHVAHVDASELIGKHHIIIICQGCGADVKRRGYGALATKRRKRT